MAANSIVARKLCTNTELELFTSSLQKNIRPLDEKTLKSRITRSRKLRDKYHHVANRQNREARGKQPPRRRNSSQGSVATRKKEQLFSESLERFEKRYEELEYDRQQTEKKSESKPRTTKKPAIKKTVATTGKRKAANKEKSGAKSAMTKTKKKARQKATATAKKSRFTASGVTRKQKHRSADNRRRQARRDSK